MVKKNPTHEQQKLTKRNHFLISQLQSQALAYLKHRFFVINDKISGPDS